MNIIASFDRSVYLELVLTALEENGIPKEQILAVPLDKRTEERKLFDAIHKSDGVSLFDLGASLAVVFSVFGASYGFIATWGPIIWGLIGAAGGFLIGFLIDLFINKRRNQQEIIKGRSTEVFVVIQCDQDRAEMTERLLWNHFALGVAKVSD
ncbi:hypothetical protein [Priestia megaterium]|uniref:hypothetical protein n=1 Tax=Priestia megaterium TaxID=1404 RepID=UPI002E1A81D8|nr:hypothetical protein [Priestia megaterium]